MNRFILFCEEILNIIQGKRKKYIVELVKYQDNNGNDVPVGSITQNEKLVDELLLH